MRTSLALLFTCLAAPSGVAEDVVLLRARMHSSRQPLLLEMHTPQPGTTEFVGPLRASDRKVDQFAGPNPLRFAFSAQVGGGGKEALVLIRERTKKSGRLDLKIVQPPKKPNGKTGQQVGSYRNGDLGHTTSDGRPVAFAAGDFDLDGRDELLIGRRFDSGAHAIEIRELPDHKRQSIGPVLASDTSFGPGGGYALVSLAGVNADEDPMDEIAALFRKDGQPDRLLIYDPPSAVGTSTGPPLAEDLNVSIAGGVNVSIAPIDPEEDGGDRLLVLRELDNSTQRLDTYPANFTGDLGSPVSSDATPADPAEPVRFAFGAALLKKKTTFWNFHGVNTAPGGGAHLFYLVGRVPLEWAKGRAILTLPDGQTVGASMVAPNHPGTVRFQPAQTTFQFSFAHAPSFGFGSITTLLPESILIADYMSVGPWIVSEDPPPTTQPPPIGSIHYDIGLDVDVHWLALSHDS